MANKRNRMQSPPVPPAESRGERLRAAQAAREGGTNGTEVPTEVVELNETDQLRAQNFLLEKQLVDTKKALLQSQAQNLELQKKILELQSQQLSRTVNEVEENRKGWLTRMGVEDGDNVNLQRDRLLIQRADKGSTGSGD